jgi:hypothetical protein
MMSKPTQVFETVRNADGIDDLVLCGIENLENACIEYSSSVYYKNITEDNSIANVVGLGENNRFFYVLESYENNVIVKYEHGLGYAYQEGNNKYFKRSVQIYSGTSKDNRGLCHVQTSSFFCDPNRVTVLRSTLPEQYFLCFIEDNSVLISAAPFLPTSLHLDNNSLLGRLDGDLVSIPIDSAEFVEKISNAFSQYTKQLSLKASKLTVNKLSARQIQLDSSNKSGAKKGTLIYDEDTDTIQFFNGNTWRRLQWVEEENLE